MSAVNRPAIGLLDLHDTHARAWERHRLDALVAPLLGAGATRSGPSFRAMAPPPCTIVVADYLDPAPFRAAAGWLALAAGVIVIRRLEPGDADIEPELAELVDEDWDAALELVRARARLDWQTGEPQAAALVVHEALACARRFASGPDCPAWAPDPPAPRAHPRLPATGWLPAAPLDPGGFAPLRAGCSSHDGAAVGLADSEGQVHRLDERWTGATFRTWPRAALDLRRDRRLLAIERGRVALVDADGRRHAELAAAHRYPIGLAPSSGRAGSWAWIGSRCTFEWLWTDGDALARVCWDAREWPCGHAKKLYGYKDNDADWIVVAPSGDAVLSVYEHDALIADAVPLRWTCHALDGPLAGPLALLCWPPVADPTRALLFESSAEHQAMFEAEPEDEDARVAAPPILLGPSPELRYAVGLARETWRLRGEHAERLGGPDEGWAVYAADHQLVRRAPGRLLGGGGPTAFVEHGGALWREQLATGAREPIGPSEVEIARAMPVPGADNLVLVAIDGRVRLL